MLVCRSVGLSSSLYLSLYLSLSCACDACRTLVMANTPADRTKRQKWMALGTIFGRETFSAILGRVLCFLHCGVFKFVSLLVSSLLLSLVFAKHFLKGCLVQKIFESVLHSATIFWRALCQWSRLNVFFSRNSPRFR